MKNIAIIPARGGSKGIYKKNIKNLCGRPLIAWTIEAAKKSKCFDDVVVSTDDDEIIEISSFYGANCVFRTKELAQDGVHSVNVVIDYLNKVKGFDNVCMLLPTSPLRTHLDIIGAVNLFGVGSCDSVISVCKINKGVSSFRKLKEYGYIEPLINVDNFEKQRQDFNEILFEVNGSIYVSSCNNILLNKSFHVGKIKPFVMDSINSIDINDNNDFYIAESLAIRRNINI